MKYLVTSALPYANGPIHFGHIAGVYLPADIYVRHLKYLNQKVMHICGSDEHGVAIMQNAQKKKKKYKDYVDKWHQEHKTLFDLYNIEFEFFGQTSTDYHAEEVVQWFSVLYEKGFIEKKTEEQLQCQSCKNYLPDRYVEGECYECGYEEARGDECPKCGIWIDPVKLINPVCKFCDSKDIEVKDVDQWYLMLSKFHSEYREWFLNASSDWKKTVTSFVNSLTEKEMVDRAITRDLDWGIDVPLKEAIGKKLYVWFDAPIGYVSNTKKYLESIQSNEDYLNDWWLGEDTKIVNFIGKDNIIFHGVIFPMMCLASQRAKAVTSLPANQYVNLEGGKFSKSKGWYVDAKQALNEFGQDNLRYYLTTLIPESTDSNFSWDGFSAKVNNELANNIGNFVNRSMSFFYKNWKDGIEKEYFESFFENSELEEVKKHIQTINGYMKKVQIKRALEEVMSLGQMANTFFSDREPWALIKTDEVKCREVIAHSALLTFVLGVKLAPFLPDLSRKMMAYFPEEFFASFDDVYQGDFASLQNGLPEVVTLVKKPKGLVKKIDAERIEELKAEFTL